MDINIIRKKGAFALITVGVRGGDAAGKSKTIRQIICKLYYS